MASKTLNDLWYAWLKAQFGTGDGSGDDSVLTPLSPVDESVSAFGALEGNNLSAGVEICNIPAASLSAGMYKVQVYSQTPLSTNPSVPNNVEVRAGGVSKVRLIYHIVAQNSPAYQPKTPLEFYVRVDGSQTISANFIDNFAGTETQTWYVSLIATKVGA